MVGGGYVLVENGVIHMKRKVNTVRLLQDCNFMFTVLKYLFECC